MYVDYNQEVLDIIGYRKMISPTYSPGSRRSRRGVWWYSYRYHKVERVYAPGVSGMSERGL